MIRHQLLEALLQLILGPAGVIVAESDAAFLVFITACCLGGLVLGAGIAWVQIDWMRKFGFGLKALLGALFGLVLTLFAATGVISLGIAFFKG